MKYNYNKSTGEMIAEGQDGRNEGLIEFVYAEDIETEQLVLLGFRLNLPTGPINLPLTLVKRDGQVLVNILLYYAFPFGVSVTSQDILNMLKKVDPEVPTLLSNLQIPYPDVTGKTAAIDEPIVPTANPGSLRSQVQASGITISGSIAVSWSSNSESSFSVSTLHANTARILDANGNVVGTGSVVMNATSPESSAISGNDQYAINGQGSLSFYGPAETNIGVSSNWDTYSSTITGNILIKLTTDSLVLNGQVLPVGTYTISTSSASLTGSGATSSPNFAGSVSVTATTGTIELGPSTGRFSVGGKPLDPTDETTLTTYSGTVVISASSNGTDDVSFNGNAGNVLQVTASPSKITTHQDTSVTFQTNVETSFADTYAVTANAPAGWTVTIGAGGNVTVTPAPGLQSGTYPIQIIAQSSTNPDLIAQSIVDVTITPTTPGITLSVATDPELTVPFNRAQVPSAFQASIQNLGPASDTYNLSFSNLPSGFTLLDSGTSVTVPSGETGILGLYLMPTAGSTLPAPGTVLAFQVTATSTTTPSITKTQTVTFTVPTIDAVTLSSSQSNLNVTPGVSVADTITITNVGNVAETNITLAATTSSGLSLTGLAPVSLGVGQSMTETVTVTPSASTPLNSILQAIFTATYGASAATQTLTLPVDVVVPGAQVIGNASNAATQLGDTDLANRLGDLSTAITNLVQNPSSSVYRSQSVEDVNAIAVLIGDDPFLVSLAPTLKADGVALSQATTASAVQSALSQLSKDLSTLSTTLNDELAHDFTLSLVGNSQVAQPQAPVSFQIVLQDTGNATTTYDLAIAGLPNGVTAKFSQASITLGPGQVTPGTEEPGVTVTLTSTSSTVVPVFSFQITATAEGAAELTRTTIASLTARAALVSVVSVATNPPFTDPGGSVDVSARILNAVNAQQTALVSFVVKNSGGTTLYTSTPVTTTLNVTTSLSTVDLGSFNTAGFADGIDTITVVVTTPNGTPIPGANATGSLQVGSPVTATTSVNPDNLPIGSGTVTNSITVALDANDDAPLSLLGQIQPSGGTNGVAIDGTLAYVSSSAGINIIDVSNPDNPTVVGSFASSDLTAGDKFTTVRVMGDDLVVEELVINGGPPYQVLVYSLANPLAPTLLGKTNIDNLSILGAFILDDNHVYVDASWIRYYLAGDQIFQQHGEIATIDLTDPANPVDTGIAYNLPPDPNSGYPDGDSLIFSMTPFDSNTLLAGSTTATMATTEGNGEILSVDTSDPSNPAVVSTLQVPGTTYILATAKESGNRLLAIGSTGPYAAVNTATSDFGPSGNLVLITLDDTDPRNLKILSTQDLSRASRGYEDNLIPIGGDRFLFDSAGGITDEPEVLLIDASGSGDAVVSAITVPSAVTDFTVVGNDLYAASPSGLLIYNIGQSIPETPVAVKVEVPNNTGVSIVPGSFNIAPTSITTGTDFDTIEWDLDLDQATSSQTFTKVSEEAPAFRHGEESRGILSMVFS